MPIRSKLLSMIAMSAVLAVPVAPPARAENGLAGAYLAARVASSESDYAAAADYYTKALIRDPANPFLLESAVIAQLALGRLDAAVPIARQLRTQATENQLAELVLLADQLRRDDYAAALADYDAGRTVSPLVDSLVRAWAHLAQGDVSASIAAFDSVIENDALAPFGLYHKALALAQVGDFEGADSLFTGQEQPGFRMTRRGVLAHAQILGQLDREEEAIALLSDVFGADPDPAIEDLRARLEAGEDTPFDVVQTRKDGLAEVFFTVAGALNNEADDTFTLLYSRVAEALSPRHTDAMLMSAALLERQKQYGLAIETYTRIPRDDPAYHVAEMGRAEALRAAGRSEAAIEALVQLSRSHPDLPDVHRALGDALRSEDRYAEAVAAYDAAIAALPVEDKSHWVLYYVRGIAHERVGDWPKAEADFRKALALEPDQPQVLNYLGYSFLEMQTNFDEALSMIERAVAARPQDGHIVDSLAWALFRLGRYTEAVDPMERAASLMPTDPVVTDHLGDVYWAVGRRLEARFQWRRALSYYTEDYSYDFDADRVRRKLEVGLDVVLSEEGAKPITIADDAGR